jgi:two-component system sensor histidine kinase AlgZ
MTNGGTIGVDGHLYDNEIYISISNPLANENNTEQRQGNQIAQDNVRQRLAAIYGENGKLKVQESKEDYIITLIFPYQNNSAEQEPFASKKPLADKKS